VSRKTYGGQAVIEGVMFQGEDKIAIACRNIDGQIVVDTRNASSLGSKYRIFKLPFIRGTVVFWESMIDGISILTRSTRLVIGENNMPKSFNKQLFGAVIIALCVATLLFFVLPTFLASKIYTTIHGVINQSVIENTIFMIMFVAYVYFISRKENVSRLFSYHGAEHKTVNCYESGKVLNVDNVKQFTTIHPRCGTNFIVIMAIINAIFFAFFHWQTIQQRILYKTLLFPVITGVSYEFLRLISSDRFPWFIILAKPGLYLQKFTTREPDNEQIEVAIAAFKAISPEQ
jgi:uncharacterized protein YqhQ